MKKLLCVLLIFSLLPNFAFAESLGDADAHEITGTIKTSPSKTEFAKTLEDDIPKITTAAEETVPDSYRNKSGVKSLVASFGNNAEKTIATLANVSGKEMLMEGIWRIDFTDAQSAENAFIKLKKDENARTADYDTVQEFDLGIPENEEVVTEADEGGISPADAETADYYNDYNLYKNSWYLDDINAPDAWDAVKEYDGADKNSALVAVIDSGIDTKNPDLADRIYKNSAGEMVGYNLIDKSPSSFEDDSHNSYHGTRVASVISAQADNGVGICGVSGGFDVKILPLKVFSNNNPSASVLISAINKAVEHKADVINMSLTSYAEQNASGTDGKIETMQEAINKATEAGCIVVASAGNYYSNFPLYPASYDNVISVGAYNTPRERAGFSQYNDYVDVTAPGQSIVLPTHYTNGSFNCVSSSGTSFSAPIVSAAAALLRIANPKISAVQASNVIKNTASDLGKSGYDLFYGFGALDLAAAVKSAEDAYIEMTSLEYSKNLNLNVGEYTQIQTVILPKNTNNKILKFESADESVATVSNNGVVFGVSPGTVKILITADFDPSFTTDADGNPFYCSVVVAPGIEPDGKIEENIGSATFPRNTSNGEFAMYADGKIWSVKKNTSGETVVSAARSVGLPYEFCEYLWQNASSANAGGCTYVLARKFDHKFYYTDGPEMKNAYYNPDTDEYNPTYTAAAVDGKNAVICSSTGNITYITPPASAQAHAGFENTKIINADKKTVFVTDAVYIPHEKCKYYAFVGRDTQGAQYIYFSEMKKESDGSFKFLQEPAPPALASGEEYVKLFAEGQYVYLLTNKAVYRVKTGRRSDEPASGTYVKYADIDGRFIKNISVITIGSERCLVGFGGGNTLYLIAEGGTYSPVKTYDAPLSHVMEFNGGLLTVAGGILRSENINVNAAQNKSYDARLCTYGVNVLDKNKKLVSEPPVDGKFTVEYYIESIDRIIFENGVNTNDNAQNKLPVSVVFSVYDKDNGELKDVRVNNFMLDYFYVNSAFNAGANLRCEEEFNLGSGDYSVKVMTFMGNNFYWPEKNNPATTLGVFAEALKQ